MSNPILEGSTFRRDLPEARELEKCLADHFFAPDESLKLAVRGGLSARDLAIVGLPSLTIWGNILDVAARQGRLTRLIDEIATEPLNTETRSAIEAVRKVNGLGGSLHAARLLLAGERPFLDRGKLRGLLPVLQNWESDAALLVVRGDRDSGRTETQALLQDGSPDSERFVLLHENLSLKSTLRSIWKAAGASGDAPVLGAAPLTTESAELTDFWTDVHEALERNQLRLWALFDDLDKGPGRLDVLVLAQVLGIRLQERSFQRRIRLVLLGYPDQPLPDKIPGRLVREDKTELLDASHVQAFADYCLRVAGKNFDAAELPALATELCGKANANVGENVPFCEALYRVLSDWYQERVR